MEIMFVVFGRDISLILRTLEISLLKNNSNDLHRVITHSLVLVILFNTMFYSSPVLSSHLRAIEIMI